VHLECCCSIHVARDWRGRLAEDSFGADPRAICVHRHVESLLYVGLADAVRPDSTNVPLVAEGVFAVAFEQDLSRFCCQQRAGRRVSPCSMLFACSSPPQGRREVSDTLLPCKMRTSPRGNPTTRSTDALRRMYSFPIVYLRLCGVRNTQDVV
jgi:hypothetical protein